jgi:hypothetical protein
MQVKTTTIRRALGAITLSGAIALAAGCHSNPANSGPDPAQANLAPSNGQPQVLAENTSYSPQQQGEYYPQQQAPAPVEQAYPQQSGGYYPTDTEQAGEEALEETTQAPPALPEYDQPPAPGPGYMWTPGYWAWGSYGYYWVPGAWVEAPYYGALWTPPYWGWYGGRYRFHHGYWGRHVGYYGGIDYGFGYIGIGYFGGYWSGNNFYYNRAVTHVGGGIRTVYERPVVYNNIRYGGQPVSRVSYNGGRGGLNVQPRPAEIAAMHERHDAPMAVQSQARVEASQNRSQTYAVNHGRPSEAYAQHGFANSHGIAPAPRGVEAARPTPEVRPGQPNAPYGNERGGNPHGQPYANEPRVENHAIQPQPYAGNPHFDSRQAQPQQQTQPGHFDNRAQPYAGNPHNDNRQLQSQPYAGNPHFDNRAQPQPQQQAQPGHFDNRAQPQPQPQQPRVEQPRTDNRAMQPQPNAPRFEHQPSPQPQPRAEYRPQPQPQPQPQPRMENRPQPQPQPQRMEAPRPENRPQPQPQQQPHPQGPPPQAHPAPQQQQPQQPHGGGEHGGGNNGHQGGGDNGHR